LKGVNLGLESGIGLDNMNVDARVVGENFKRAKGRRRAALQ
jgi:hypothetical protein